MTLLTEVGDEVHVNVSMMLTVLDAEASDACTSAELEAVPAGQEDRKDLPLPEEKLQQYTPLVPGKVLYICRWAAPLPAFLCYSYSKVPVTAVYIRLPFAPSSDTMQTLVQKRSLMLSSPLLPWRADHQRSPSPSEAHMQPALVSGPQGGIASIGSHVLSRSEGEELQRKMVKGDHEGLQRLCLSSCMITDHLSNRCGQHT